ncbi:hypothetical protein [Paractinoplanes toevensis]|uniref:Uncharacterized protein n=1 Tax=Paractinoplanes toevensis TaxID=571911 RepID=A0A919TGH1_9ACTN|nr:hypothetical protein [Actinoplanes toevensis]GIM94963.1 hypothetical protein Ato02nite_067560 [Actinoplanes toevensis]
MTEDLRALLRADLYAERPPPLGDVVGAAIRDGRRLRRKRRLGVFGTFAAMIALAGVGAVVLRDGPVAVRPQAPAALPPQNVPAAPATAPMAALKARTLTVHSGTERADGNRTKATSGAMLVLMLQLLPPGRTSHYGVAADDDLHVQLSLDDGRGPAMIRVAVARNAPVGDKPPGAAFVTISEHSADCRLGTTVDAQWPDGTLVEVDLPACPGRPALTPDEAVRLAADPRWGVTMAEDLVAEGTQRFPAVPVLG